MLGKYLIILLSVPFFLFFSTNCTDSHNFTKIEEPAEPEPVPPLEIVGKLGVYVDQGEDLNNFNLKCMLEQSQKSGYNTIKILTGEGGPITIKKVGGPSETLDLPAKSAIFLYSNRGNGIYKIYKNGECKVKTCFSL